MGDGKQGREQQQMEQQQEELQLSDRSCGAVEYSLRASNVCSLVQSHNMHIDSGITPALSGRLIPRPCWLPPCQTAYLKRTMRRGRQATSDRSHCVLAAPAVLTAALDSRCAACCVMHYISSSSSASSSTSYLGISTASSSASVWNARSMSWNGVDATVALTCVATSRVSLM